MKKAVTFTDKSVTFWYTSTTPSTMPTTLKRTKYTHTWYKPHIQFNGYKTQKKEKEKTFKEKKTKQNPLTWKLPLKFLKQERDP